jgi:hypothetical protein
MELGLEAVSMIRTQGHNVYVARQGRLNGDQLAWESDEALRTRTVLFR